MQEAANGAVKRTPPPPVPKRKLSSSEEVIIDYAQHSQSSTITPPPAAATPASPTRPPPPVPIRKKSSDPSIVTAGLALSPRGSSADDLSILTHASVPNRNRSGTTVQLNPDPSSTPSRYFDSLPRPRPNPLRPSVSQEQIPLTLVQPDPLAKLAPLDIVSPRGKGDARGPRPSGLLRAPHDAGSTPPGGPLVPPRQRPKASSERTPRLLPALPDTSSSKSSRQMTPIPQPSSHGDHPKVLAPDLHQIKVEESQLESGMKRISGFMKGSILKKKQSVDGDPEKKAADLSADLLGKWRNEEEKRRKAEAADRDKKMKAEEEESLIELRRMREEQKRTSVMVAASPQGLSASATIPHSYQTEENSAQSISKAESAKKAIENMYNLKDKPQQPQQSPAKPQPTPPPQETPTPTSTTTTTTTTTVSPPVSSVHVPLAAPTKFKVKVHLPNSGDSARKN